MVAEPRTPGANRNPTSGWNKKDHGLWVPGIVHVQQLQQLHKHAQDYKRPAGVDGYHKTTNNSEGNRYIIVQLGTPVNRDSTSIGPEISALHAVRGAGEGEG